MAPPKAATHELGHNMIPERLFERDWALTLLAAVFDALRREYDSRGKIAAFETLKPVLERGTAPSHTAKSLHVWGWPRGPSRWSSIGYGSATRRYSANKSPRPSTNRPRSTTRFAPLFNALG